MYFPRYLIGSILTACFAVVIKYLGKYLTIYLILSCAEEGIYKRQNSNFVLYINTFRENNSLKSVLIAVSHASDWEACYLFTRPNIHQFHAVLRAYDKCAKMISDR